MMLQAIIIESVVGPAASLATGATLLAADGPSNLQLEMMPEPCHGTNLSLQSPPNVIGKDSGLSQAMQAIFMSRLLYKSRTALERQKHHPCSFFKSGLRLCKHAGQM